MKIKYLKIKCYFARHYSYRSNTFIGISASCINRQIATIMHSVFFLSAFSLLVIVAHAQRTNTYEYYVPQISVPNHDSRIERMPNGDTVLVASYNIQNATQKTYQQITKTYKGTPYFGNGWYQGNIIQDDGHKTSFRMAYNIQKRELYLLTGLTQEVSIVNPPMFELLNHSFKRYNGVYIETIYRGTYSLLKEHICKLFLAQAAQKTGYDSATDKDGYEGEFRKFAKFYLQIGNRIIEIKSRKTLIKYLEKNNIQLDEYIKSNRLNIKKEADLVKIFRYLDKDFNY